MRSRWLFATCVAVLLAAVSLSLSYVARGVFRPDRAREELLSAVVQEKTGEAEVPEIPREPSREDKPPLRRVPIITITHEPEPHFVSFDDPPQPLPVISEDDGKDGPILALVIDDFGYNANIASRILKLKLPATWAIIPNAPHSESVAALAAKHGQPFIMHIPMQALGDPDGGRDYLIGTDTSAAKIEAVVAMLKERFPKAIGANNHRGSKATSHAPAMRAFMKAFAETGWGFIDSRTSPRSVAESIAREYHIPVAHNVAFIDGTTDLSTMKRQFSLALRHARKQGAAVAICHAREKTMPFLTYLSTLDTKPVRLVGADAVWKRRNAVKEEKR